MESGQLEYMLMPPPSGLAAKLWRRFGYTALATGLALILLITYSVLFAYRKDVLVGRDLVPRRSPRPPLPGHRFGRLLAVQPSASSSAGYLAKQLQHRVGDLDRGLFLDAVGSQPRLVAAELVLRGRR